MRLDENEKSWQVRITPDQMLDIANRYRTEADTFNGVISKMDSLFQQLQSEVGGSGSKSYAIRYQELKPGLEKTEELIREIASSLDFIAQDVLIPDTALYDPFKD